MSVEMEVDVLTVLPPHQQAPDPGHSVRDLDQLCDAATTLLHQLIIAAKQLFSHMATAAAGSDTQAGMLGLQQAQDAYLSTSGSLREAIKACYRGVERAEASAQAHEGLSCWTPCLLLLKQPA